MPDRSKQPTMILRRKPGSTAAAILYPLLTVVWCSGCGTERSPRPVTVHPVFRTPVTGKSSSRPAVQVDILDESEHWFGTAELYLTVQSSRFPESTWIVLPLNIGDFSGCRSRFVQLPFEVQSGDLLLFNLLDNDELAAEQEDLILEGCRGCGFCVLVAGEVFCPTAAMIVAPVIPIATEILGQAVVADVHMHCFDNMGTAEYPVPKTLPSEPQQAAKLSLLDDSNRARVVLKIFGPDELLPFVQESPAKPPNSDSARRT
jgi:hypothetical protein